jgi:hypothetical protein
VPDLVECHSNSSYPEQPVTLTWQDQRLEVSEILSRWRTPQGLHFRVETTDEQFFELSFDETTQEWRIQPF